MTNCYESRAVKCGLPRVGHREPVAACKNDEAIDLFHGGDVLPGHRAQSVTYHSGLSVTYHSGSNPVLITGRLPNATG